MEKPAPDHDQWLSCYECGNTFPRHETFVNSKINDSVQTTDNPFENESIFLSTETRKEQRRKGKKRKGRFSHKQELQDPEIQRAIDRGLAVNILYDSNR
jgi:hypothetical protein